jgi:hypothetical protein
MARSYTPTLSRARSSVGERSLHTREVGGSKPPAPIGRSPATAGFFVGGVMARALAARALGPICAPFASMSPPTRQCAFFDTVRRLDSPEKCACTHGFGLRSWPKLVPQWFGTRRAHAKSGARGTYLQPGLQRVNGYSMPADRWPTVRRSGRCRLGLDVAQAGRHPGMDIGRRTRRAHPGCGLLDCHR